MTTLSLQTVSSCFLAYLVIFLRKVGYVVSKIGTDVNQFLVRGFMLIWLEVGPCLMFSIGVCMWVKYI